VSHALTGGETRAAVSTFQLPHVAVPARLTLAQGRPQTGTIFLAARVPHHDGPETPLELLNRPEPFFPFRLEESGDVLLVARSQTVTVAVQHGPIADPDRLSASKELRFELVLSNATTITGHAQVELPEHHSRTLDYLNAGAAPFIALSSHDSTHYVNRAHVMFARPQD
jgi:hypothetical protein